MSSLPEQVQFYISSLIHSYLKSPGPFFTSKDYPDLTGQTWVVTGATGGIGLELAKILTRLNARVWIVGRSVPKLEAALETLHKVKPLTAVDFTVIDYNDLATVKPGVEKIVKSTKQLDGIIHNTGIMNVPKGSKTKQGYEQQLGVNNLATQLVQDLLDPLIENTPHGRIVWLSSSGHTLSPPNGFELKAIDKLSPWPLYGQTKALNIIQSVQWARKHPNSKVKVLSAHPGAIQTDLTRSSSKLEKYVISWLQYPTEYGAYPPIYAALSPDVKNLDYIVPWGRPGLVRPDVYRAARNEYGEQADTWIEEQITPFK